MNDDPPGRKEITQERIVAAAMTLFLRRGFERTSITQIARSAKVSRGAVFWHFGDKETLFREACRRFIVPFREELAGPITHLPPKKRLYELFAAYESFVEVNREQIQAFVGWVVDSPVHSQVLRDHLLELHELFRLEIEAALEELLGDKARAVALADAFVSLMDGNLLLNLVGGQAEDGRLRSGLRAMARAVLGDPE